MFEEGDFALVKHAMRRATEAMAAEMEGMALERMSGDDRIVAGVKARLRFLAPFVEDGTWARAMAVGALPQHALATTLELGVMADELWYLAGDQSTDTAWYTRRGLLLAVHSATELFMLTDKSDGFEDTWAFLERRVSDASSLGSQAGSVGDVAEAVRMGATSLAGGALELARPFVEAQKGNPAEAIRSVASSFFSVARAAQEGTRPTGEQEAPAKPAQSDADEPRA